MTKPITDVRLSTPVKNVKIVRPVRPSLPRGVVVAGPLAWLPTVGARAA